MVHVRADAKMEVDLCQFDSTALHRLQYLAQQTLYGAKPTSLNMQMTPFATRCSSLTTQTVFLIHCERFCGPFGLVAPAAIIAAFSPNNNVFFIIPTHLPFT